MAYRHPGWEAAPTADAFDDIVDRLLGFVPRYGLQHGWRPSLDVYGDATGLTVIVELPGVDQHEVRVTVEQNRLRIAGTRRTPRPDAAPLRLEMADGPFERILALPVESDGDAITAQLHQGLLTIHVPRRAPRPVPVRGAPPGEATNE
jgi:HSP20 family protein